MDNAIKQTAMSYFKAAREAEESVAKYQRIKYDADQTYMVREQTYNNMMTALMKLSNSEVAYKETVDEANNYVQKFRKIMLKKCRLLRNLEFSRCDQIHSSINQFVVFEMSAEMNNKYDLGNFAKILDDFTPQQEMKTLDQYLYGVVQAQGDDDPVEIDGAANRSNSNLEESKSSFTESETGSVFEEGEVKEGQEDNKTAEQMMEEVTILPNAFVPIVLNPKFEFVPFESNSKK